jgi:hypothetical protein
MRQLVMLESNPSQPTKRDGIDAQTYVDCVSEGCVR